MPRRTPRTRRQFIRDVAVGAAATATVLALPALQTRANTDQAPDQPLPADALGQGQFLHGVASGDPLAHQVILWTRVTPQRPGRLPVAWEVAEDAAFGLVVRKGVFTTGPERDYTVKVDVLGLEADTHYHYRFRTGNQHSPVGHTRTLPVGDVEEVRLAVFSCSNFPAGYFHVYREAAREQGLHAVVHLGDYLYEYQRGGYASQDAPALGREVEPAHELLALDDYRRRHAQYRGDPDLQALHAALPFICVWDDHEVANDTWREGADNHDPDTEGDFSTRRAAALQAYREWMPVRQPDPADPLRIYRSFHFGDLLSLHMLDTRMIARDKQLAYGDYFAADGRFDAARFASDLASPTRQLLGDGQTLWLQDALASSGARWQVLGQQVLMARMSIPAPLALGDISFANYAALLAKASSAPDTLTAQERMILAQPAIPYNLDAWDGYPAARETVLGQARNLDKNLVVLAGDTHNAWASNLADHHGNPVGVEFATASVSSPGLEEYLSGDDPTAVAAALTRLIPPLEYAETGHRGFMIVTVRHEECRVQWRFVSTVKIPAYFNIVGRSLAVRPGAGNRKLVA